MLTRYAERGGYNIQASADLNCVQNSVREVASADTHELPTNDMCGCTWATMMDVCTNRFIASSGAASCVYVGKRSEDLKASFMFGKPVTSPRETGPVARLA